MNIREGLKVIKNTEGILFSGDTEIIYEDGKFWEKGKTFHAELNYIPIEFELLDWKVKAPEPTLKAILSKLKVKEFDHNDDNYSIEYMQVGYKREWKLYHSDWGRRLGTIYFKKHMAVEVIEYMNKNKISWEEFISTWEEVQRERGE